MDDDKDGGAGTSGGGTAVGENSNSRVTSSFETSGDRKRFKVELRPGETTIVSWKKLLKDAGKRSAGSKSAAATVAPEPAPATGNHAIEPQLASGEAADGELQDAPAPHRFSAVIEKIERLYMGKHSSDEEDIDDNLDDDQYDTEDSFIDDEELDEYFQVDNSAIKHDGFFVNRGTLERITEPTLMSNQQPKKRRRKDSANPQAVNGEGHVPNKHLKVSKKIAKNSYNPSLIGTREDVKLQNRVNASIAPSQKKFADSAKSPLESSPSLRVSNGYASVPQSELMETEIQKTGLIQSKNPSNKMKDARDQHADPSHQKHHEKSEHVKLKPHSGHKLNNANQVEVSVPREEKNDTREQPNLSDSKHSAQAVKASVIHKKEGSSVKSKGNTLEKAIRELEKMVAESRPPAMEIQDADTSQAIKRRLPQEIKQKLAKVARLAQASHGKISKELINRLMSILGHLMQLQTLKRNLKIMVNMGLSATHEKDARFQKKRKELIETITMQLPSLKSKALEQQVGSSDDFQVSGLDQKAVQGKSYTMDEALEDMVCDLYDVFVEGLEEDRAPQIRKLYVELAELWPSGLMDNHGIKRAICRAKDRRRQLHSQHKVKDQERIKKKSLAPKLEIPLQIEANSTAQPQQIQERPLVIESITLGLPSTNRPISTAATTTITTAKIHGASMNTAPKHDKVTASPSLSTEEPKTPIDGGAMIKKKVKKKVESETGEARPRHEKKSTGEERPKSHKQSSSLSLAHHHNKLNLQSSSAQNFEKSADVI